MVNISLHWRALLGLCWDTALFDTGLDSGLALKKRREEKGDQRGICDVKRNELLLLVLLSIKGPRFANMMHERSNE